MRLNGSIRATSVVACSKALEVVVFGMEEEGFCERVLFLITRTDRPKCWKYDHTFIRSTEGSCRCPDSVQQLRDA
jgi:hypothetical protein